MAGIIYGVKRPVVDRYAVDHKKLGQGYHLDCERPLKSKLRQQVVPPSLPSLAIDKVRPQTPLSRTNNGDVVESANPLAREEKAKISPGCILLGI